MRIHTKKTLHAMLVVSVASGLMLTGCSSTDSKQQPRMDTSKLQAPRQNPNFNGNVMTMPQDGMRAPEGNVQNMAQAPQMPQASAPAPHMARKGAAAPQTAQQQKSGGLFDWAWARKQEESPMANVERRVPKLNQGGAIERETVAMASYEAAAPVGDVQMGMPAGLTPQSDIVVADEVIMMDDSFTPVMQEQLPQEYPSLASVPLRPERLDAAKNTQAQMAADLEQARAATYAQSASLENQVMQDSAGSMLPQAHTQMAGAQDNLDAEFAALVAADNAGGIPVVMEEQPAVVVSGQDAAPIVMANTQAQDSGWQPAPLTPQATPQTTQPMQVIQEDEWVSLDMDPATQMAVPVEQVQVGMPQVAAVSAVPVVPNDTVGGIRLTPPAAMGHATRTLPESRYAARREAVYMQRYSRMPRGQ